MTINIYLEQYIQQDKREIKMRFFNHVSHVLHIYYTRQQHTKLGKHQLNLKNGIVTINLKLHHIQMTKQSMCDITSFIFCLQGYIYN